MERIIDKIRRSVFDDSEIIQEIEIPGFDINLVYNTSTLLMVAVGNGREDLVRYILSVPGINVNHRNYYGTALHFCNRVSILKLLLDRKDLDVNIRDDDLGNTGLHGFCICGSKKYVRELLLDARVNVLIHNKYGYTARALLLSFGYPGFAKIINNSRYTTLLRIPNRALIHDIVRMIIEEYT